MTTRTLQRLCVLLTATAIGLLFITQCHAQLPQPPVRLMSRTYLEQQYARTQDTLRWAQTELGEKIDTLTLLRDRYSTRKAATDTEILGLTNRLAGLETQSNARITDLTRQVTALQSKVATLEDSLRVANTELLRYRPRTWAGRQLRKAWNGLAVVGVGTVGYIALKLTILR